MLVIRHVAISGLLMSVLLQWPMASAHPAAQGELANAAALNCCLGAQLH